VRLPWAWIALGIGLLLALLLIGTGALPNSGARRLPLLTQLIVAEFGFFLTAIGAGAAVRSIMARGFSPALAAATLGCALLAAGFLWLGLQLWPDGAFG
jgi:hypothetical protein